jgi:hypothetical protein
MRKRTKRKPEGREATALRESVKYIGPETDGAPPKDMDVFRFALTRRLRALLGDPQRCRDPACRRSGRCAGLGMRCARDMPQARHTPEQEAQMGFEVMRALEQRRAELKS